MRKIIIYSFVISGLWTTSCQSDQSQDEAEPSLTAHEDVVYKQLDLEPIPLSSINPTGRIQPQSEYRLILHKAEYIAASQSGQQGVTVIFNDRGNKQLRDDFSPFASLDGSSDISYYLDQTRPSSSMSLAPTESALQRVVTTWESVQCSELGLNRVSNIPIPIGIVSAIFGFSGEPVYVADVNHAGWMPGSFFEILAPGGSRFILGVTFTLLLVDRDGNFIDTNQDGRWDVGLREIYYNDNFSWSDDGTAIDVETVALHEMGHGLSQAHFGKGFIKKNGDIQFAPRAVMNATYSGVQTRISGTDLGGHCSNWANWPKK